MNWFKKYSVRSGIGWLPKSSLGGQSDSLMRGRMSRRFLLVILASLVIFLYWVWTGCGTSAVETVPLPPPHDPCPTFAAPPHAEPPAARLFEAEEDEGRLGGGKRVALEEIECQVNDEFSVSCRREGGEVYVPFSLVHKYFEVNGKVVKRGGSERFEWQHSYSKVYFPRQSYDPDGAYLWFENYNVEVRDRVKCISGIEGVPVSTQWDTRGHFYPIQIAQFGLSHFSKNLTEPAPLVLLVEDGEKTLHGKWLYSRVNRPSLRRVVDAGSTLLEFKTRGPGTEISLSLEEGLDVTTLNCDLMLISNASMTVVLSSNSDQTLYKIHYVMSDIHVSIVDSDVYYGVGARNKWRTLTRDLVIDLNKGLHTAQGRHKIPKPKNLQVRSIILRGHGRIDNISLSSSSHVAHFFSAADWFLNHQDKNGGWPNTVTRKLSNGMLELAPGWYSAMAQGQAMSLLTRAFKASGNLGYLEAALRATKLFNVRSEHRGILTTFLGKYIWYEEYPTIPSSFVLNGFIYSLFGLYDVQQSGTHPLCREAGKMFQNGLVSLKKMLPLFDTGSGSIYDLRHFSLGVAPNLARWDYHSTHINQLLFLNTIHDDQILRSVAERWTGYMKGKKAPHN
ncbi:D-glucuronyl C5-epimerase B-like [Uloborus diversus]|uniref:D-glucuronyl C5-epimerase B-like n=1 Tax=Uloborus diversus TaxID=327109 RepID=UPI0024093A99|nr:D-glucuronyl C5-epimerase B-like [Uloborus diversus]